MAENAVIFKGTKDGLYIILKEEMDLNTIKYNLEKKIKPSKRFFEGANIMNFKGKKLTQDEFDELKEIMEQEYGMTVIGGYNDKDHPVHEEHPVIKKPEILEQLPFDNVHKGEALIVRATLRSGQLIQYIGDVVVIGDVNPGAHIKAAGSVIVMGTVRGIIQAGANGDYGAFIVAYKMQPSQLRIGDIITRSPDGMGSKSDNPEIALVKQGMIVVEPYLKNR
ncbi:MAG TPA: septum site-determining protein MinC [Bacillota bacterium]|nr:septum site-determining protein MinC [Bacillota bacterium]HQL36036.1 septum site-determining protein MinC [Bacillota bacterium]HRS22134.1 septum site-determining protein MinC [Clostridia bacterium]